MNKKTGSVISLLLSIILIFSVVCPMAFAADTEEKKEVRETPSLSGRFS